MDSIRIYDRDSLLLSSIHHSFKVGNGLNFQGLNLPINMLKLFSVANNKQQKQSLKVTTSDKHEVGKYVSP